MKLTHLRQEILGQSPLVILAGTADLKIPLLTFEALGHKISKKKLFVGTAHPDYLETAIVDIDKIFVTIFDGGGYIDKFIPQAIASTYRASLHAQIVVYAPGANNPTSLIIAQMAFQNGCRNFIGVALDVSPEEVRHRLIAISPTLETTPILDARSLTPKTKPDFILQYTELLKLQLKHFLLEKQSNPKTTTFVITSIATQGLYKGIFRARGYLYGGPIVVGTKLNAISAERSCPIEVTEVTSDDLIIFRSHCATDVLMLTNRSDISVRKDAKAFGLGNEVGRAELYQPRWGHDDCYVENGKIETRYIPELATDSNTDPNPGFIYCPGDPILVVIRKNGYSPKFTFANWL